MGIFILTKQVTQHLKNHNLNLKFTFVIGFFFSLIMFSSCSIHGIYIERLNRFYREDVLDAYWFNDLYQLRTLSNTWREDYNNNHPHESLGNKPPREYKLRSEEKSSLEKDIINENLLNLAVS